MTGFHLLLGPSIETWRRRFTLRIESTLQTCNPAISLTVIVLNYRTSRLTCECLQSLAEGIQAIPNSRVIVVDNASNDGSAVEIAAEITARKWERWATLLPLNVNVGFAAGNNRAFDQVRALTKYVLLLNSDTFVRLGCLERCFSIMESDPKIGLLSCMVLNADESTQNVARRFPTPLNQFAAALGLPFRWPRLFGWANVEDPLWDRLTTKRDVDWIGGAFMFARAEMLRQIGLFDDDFFFYGEDVELCHRAWKHGWRVHFDPAGSIVHYGGASSDPLRLPESQRSGHRWHARYLVQRKCYGWLAEWMLRLTDISYYSVRLAILRLRGARQQERYRQVFKTLSLLLGILSRDQLEMSKRT